MHCQPGGLPTSLDFPLAPTYKQYRKEGAGTTRIVYQFKSSHLEVLCKNICSENCRKFSRKHPWSWCPLGCLPPICPSTNLLRPQDSLPSPLLIPKTSGGGRNYNKIPLSSAEEKHVDTCRVMNTTRNKNRRIYSEKVS